MTNQEIYLMNVATGSVDTKENWLSEIDSWGDNAQEQFDSLVEVVKNKNGEWVEVE